MEKPHPILEDLPADICRAVGRIISAHALIEHYIQMSIVSLTGLGHREARLSLAEPRVESRLQTIKSLIKVHGLSVAIPSELTAAKLKRAREDRNLMAHGVWSKAAQGYIVIQTAGTNEYGESRKITPAGVVTDSEALAAFLVDLKKSLKAAQILRERVDTALAASPRKAK